MKVLQKIDLTKKDEPKYTTFFYHKNSKFVYEVVTNGNKCALSIAEECNINKQMKSGSSLPKYILKSI